MSQKLHQNPQIFRNSTKFECVFCHFIIQKKSKLIIHMRIHTGDKTFSCKNCSKQFSQLSMFQINSSFVHSFKFKISIIFRSLYVLKNYTCSLLHFFFFSNLKNTHFNMKNTEYKSLRKDFLQKKRI